MDQGHDYVNDLTEKEIDGILSDSFPASDAPSWTLGVVRRAPT